MMVVLIELNCFVPDLHISGSAYARRSSPRLITYWSGRSAVLNQVIKMIVFIKVLSCTLVCFCHLDREVWKITYKISFLLTLSMKVNKLLYVVIYSVLFVLTLLERLYFLFAVLKANKTTKDTAIQDVLLYFCCLCFFANCC